MPVSPAAVAAGAAEAAEAERHRSPGFAYLIERLRSRRGLAVLDLGPALASNVAFWGRFRPRLTVADLRGDFSTTGAPPRLGPDGRFPGLAHLVPDGPRFRVALAWDLLNYLDRPGADALVRWLRESCLPGALVFAMMWNVPAIPERPLRFHVEGDGELRYEGPRGGERRGPAYAPAEVERLFAGFDVAASYLLRNRLQEYVLEKR